MPTILEIAPSLAEDGKRLIDAGELRRVLEWMLGQLEAITGGGGSAGAGGALLDTFANTTAGNVEITPEFFDNLTEGVTYHVNGGNIPPGTTGVWPVGGSTMTLSNAPTTTAKILVSVGPAVAGQTVAAAPPPRPSTPPTRTPPPTTRRR